MTASRSRPCNGPGERQDEREPDVRGNPGAGQLPPMRMSMPSASSRAGMRPVCNACVRAAQARPLEPDEPRSEDRHGDEEEERASHMACPTM